MVSLYIRSSLCSAEYPAYQISMNNLLSTQIFRLDTNRIWITILIAEQIDYPTRISIRISNWEYNRMTFGLSNGVATFQKLADLVFCGIKGIDCIVYLDDACIASASWEDHLVTLEEVFKRFIAAGLTIKLDKRKFAFSSINVLGYKIDEKGIHPMEDKLSAMKQMPEPLNLDDLRRFLGCTSYYRRFIINYAQKAAPLFDLIKKEV